MGAAYLVATVKTMRRSCIGCNEVTIFGQDAFTCGTRGVQTNNCCPEMQTKRQHGKRAHFGPNLLLLRRCWALFGLDSLNDLLSLRFIYRPFVLRAPTTFCLQYFVRLCIPFPERTTFLSLFGILCEYVLSSMARTVASPH